MVQFSLWDIFTFLLGALRWTAALSLIAFIGGGLVGMSLLMLRFTKLRGAATAVAWYVQIFQGTPLLMQLFLVYFGLALLGMDTSPLVSAAICLTLYASAYLTEIWRGCVNAIPKGQWEASASLASASWTPLQNCTLTNGSIYFSYRGWTNYPDRFYRLRSP